MKGKFKEYFHLLGLAINFLIIILVLYSGLKGIDFASFPIVSKWIKSSINTALSSYLEPQNISIDILAWLRGDDRIVSYFES